MHAHPGRAIFDFWYYTLFTLVCLLCRERRGGIVHDFRYLSLLIIHLLGKKGNKIIEALKLMIYNELRHCGITWLLK